MYQYRFRIRSFSFVLGCLWLVGLGLTNTAHAQNLELKGGAGVPVYVDETFTVMNANGEFIQADPSESFFYDDGLANVPLTSEFSLPTDLSPSDQALLYNLQSLADELGATVVIDEAGEVIIDTHLLPGNVGSENWQSNQELGDPVSVV